ncbi:MAG: hypothetical protein DMD72_06560 [Gemmatimonadetes bacterium]|nr:MAG: hypothetical protein DMD72_06560 [Gemmatimonadota bacterium]PYO78992.1 MAG: hypothetical protein DMD63_05595 [Gemmatimonadota bacterium]
MFDSFAQIFPAQWQGAVLLLLAPLRWLADVQSTIVQALLGAHPAGRLLLWVVLLIPALVIAAGMWCTALSLYTIPFRSGRGTFVTALLMTWWDAGRCIWLFWTGIMRVGVALVGWVIGSVRFGLLMLKNLLVGIVRSPLTMLDGASRSYFQPGVPWVAFLVLTVWCAIESTVFTFTLQPTLIEVFGSLTGFDPNPRIMAPLLWMFLFLLVAGSFACVQVVTDAIKTKKIGTIVQMLVVESAVMFFEVIFLYRELIDAITPWIAQQSGDSVRLGLGATLALASFGWLGVRGMSWFLFGRFGTPALLAVLSRQAVEHQSGARPAAAPPQPEIWRAPINALKAETAWFHEEAKRMFELLTLPVLQLFAAAINFAVIVVQSHPMFELPFTSLDDVLATTPTWFHARPSHEKREKGRMRTPMDPMPRIAS